MDSQQTSLLLLGAEHAEAGRLQAAEDAFAAAVLHDPGLHIARFQLGLLQWSTGHAGAALVTWQPLSTMAEGVDLGHFARAFAHWGASQLADAAAEFRQGIACCGNEPLARDMQKMQDTITDLMAARPASENQEQHVLLANYVSAGQAH